MKKFSLIAAVALCLAHAAPARAGILGRLFGRHRPPAYAATYSQTTVVNTQGGGGPAEFLAALNAYRAACGRGPLAWDANLAAFAATNAGVHAPGSSGGGSQCWAGVHNYTQALQMWIASPAHRALLLNARWHVGVSTCPSGATCNLR